MIQAENAMTNLKQAGFSESEIGIATAGHNKKEGFWDNVKRAFGKEEHTESVDDFQNSLQACGVPDNQAQYFNNAIGEGDILVTVNAKDERASRARSILQQEGADIASDTAGTPAAKTWAAEGGRRIQLLGEVLRVHKERVQRGEVRLRKEVVTDTQNIGVPVSREELVVERVPGQGRDASGQVGTGEKEIRVPLSEERVNVEKKPVVTEEVRVAKRQVQDTKRVSDTVKHEELRGEHDGNITEESCGILRTRNARVTTFLRDCWASSNAGPLFYISCPLLVRTEVAA